MGYQGSAQLRDRWGKPAPSLNLNLRRVASVRSAFIKAQWQAGNLLSQRFADIDISIILDDLIDVVTQMAMIVAASALAGGAVGAGVGALFGGVGAVPGGAAGAALGVQIGSWILGVLGLQAIAEFFVEGLPAIGEYYVRGIKIAWEGPRSDDGSNAFGQDDPFAVGRAADSIAFGHVEVVTLLLGAIVAYLTRGRGSAGKLAQEMRASPKGANIGQWVVDKQDALKSRPDLQRSEAHRSPVAGREPPQDRPQGTDKGPAKRKANTMPLHEVECFKADNMPASKIGEFERQLKGQEGGLNKLTVEEYLENIANPVKRSRKAAQDARRDLESALTVRFQMEFQKKMSVLDAEVAAAKEVAKTMSTIAGLHNPDLKAGGRDVIADFGDRQVNSSIGPQWGPKIKNIRSAAEKIPKQFRNSTLLNVRLHKC